MIDGFLQTDPRLNEKVQKFGCALLSSMYVAPTKYEPEDVNSMYESLLSVGFIDEDCTILDWKSVLYSIDARLHFKCKALEGCFCGPSEREIIKWYLSNVKEDHFTVGDGRGHTVWDSMERPDIMAKYATFVEKVIVTVG